MNEIFLKITVEESVEAEIRKHIDKINKLAKVEEFNGAYAVISNEEATMALERLLDSENMSEQEKAFVQNNMESLVTEVTSALVTDSFDMIDAEGVDEFCLDYVQDLVEELSWHVG